MSINITDTLFSGGFTAMNSLKNKYLSLKKMAIAACSLAAAIFSFSSANTCHAYIHNSGDDGEISWVIESSDNYEVDKDYILKIKPSEGADGSMNNFDEYGNDCYGSVHPQWINLRVMGVEIADGITNIGDYAFFGDGIKMYMTVSKVIIPDSVTSVGKYALWGNSYLKKIYVPRSVSIIGYEAFDPATIIECESGSYAETYAKENGYRYTVTNPDIKLNKTKIETSKGKKIQLKLIDNRDNSEYTGEVSRTISDTSVALFNTDGSLNVCGYGKAVVTFKSGEKTVKCTINSIPPKVKVKSVKSSSKKKIKVTWNKSSVDAFSTVRILVSKDKTFKKGTKKYSPASSSYNSYTIGGLKSKKYYYVKVCAYNVNNGKTISGKYSKVYKVKVK